MHFEAVFEPTNKSTYNSEAGGFIGKKIALQDGWKIEEGPFKGQQGYYMPKSTLGIIPQCDLKGLKTIAYTRWKDILTQATAAD